MMNNLFFNGQMVSLDGGQGGGPRYHHATCGVRFSEYVQRTRTTDFPYCQYNGGLMKHKDLWQGRPLKVKLHKDAPRWRMAKVEAFDEWLPGPFSPHANWDVTIQFTDNKEVDDEHDNEAFGMGDIVKIHGLQGAKQHNERRGHVSKFMEESGRYAVKYEDDHGTPVCVAIKPSNIQHVEMATFRLVRCNIEGGGTMTAPRVGIKQKLSFEWLQEATPKVNLYEDGWCIKCPTCRETTRDHEMTIQSDDLLSTDHNESLVQETECPVCLDTTQCVPLGKCNHFLCLACFKGCKTKPDGSPIFRLEDIHVDESPEELARQREKLLQGSTKQWDTSIVEGGEQILEYIQDIVDATNDDDRESMVALKRWLLVHPIRIWGDARILRPFVAKLDANAAAIVCERVENLRGTEEYQELVNNTKEECRRNGVSLSPPEELAMNNPDLNHSVAMLHLTEWVALKYEEDGDYRSAISYYEKNLTYPPQFPQDLVKPAMAASLSNLGLPQKYLGLLDSAEKNYRAAMEAGRQHNSNALKNLEKLQREREEWRGTSGAVTPRMEE